MSELEWACVYLKIEMLERKSRGVIQKEVLDQYSEYEELKNLLDQNCGQCSKSISYDIYVSFSKKIYCTYNCGWGYGSDRISPDERRRKDLQTVQSLVQQDQSWTSIFEQEFRNKLTDKRSFNEIIDKYPESVGLLYSKMIFGQYSFSCMKDLSKCHRTIYSSSKFSFLTPSMIICDSCYEPRLTYQSSYNQISKYIESTDYEDWALFYIKNQIGKKKSLNELRQSLKDYSKSKDIIEQMNENDVYCKSGYCTNKLVPSEECYLSLD